MDSSSGYTGSSPQARGTAEFRRQPLARDRFIPAGAGNGRSTRSAATTTTVHPRRRGERGQLPSSSGSRSGSSPQARGTERPEDGVEDRGRFIPAGAGNGPRADPRCPPRPVHPRRRGERTSPRDANSHVFGSSPQARGTEQLRRRRLESTRFIPAGAGNGSHSSHSGGSRSVHPRRRGER